MYENQADNLQFTEGLKICALKECYDASLDGKCVVNPSILLSPLNHPAKIPVLLPADTVLHHFLTAEDKGGILLSSLPQPHALNLKPTVNSKQVKPHLVFISLGNVKKSKLSYTEKRKVIVK